MTQCLCSERNEEVRQKIMDVMGSSEFYSVYHKDSIFYHDLNFKNFGEICDFFYEYKIPTHRRGSAQNRTITVSVLMWLLEDDNLEKLETMQSIMRL